MARWLDGLLPTRSLPATQKGKMLICNLCQGCRMNAAPLLLRCATFAERVRHDMRARHDVETRDKTPDLAASCD